MAVSLAFALDYILPLIFQKSQKLLDIILSYPIYSANLIIFLADQYTDISYNYLAYNLPIYNFHLPAKNHRVYA